MENWLRAERELVARPELPAAGSDPAPHTFAATGGGTRSRGAVAVLRLVDCRACPT